MRTVLPYRGWAKSLDEQVRKMVKLAFRLPRRTASSVFYVPWRCGGFGLPNIESDLDVAWASQAFKYLTSGDDKVMLMAARRVADTMTARTTTRHPELEEILTFLNSPPNKEEYRRSYDIRSLFGLVRGSLQHLNAKFVSTEDGNVPLQVGERVLLGRQSRQSSAELRRQHHGRCLE